MTDAISVIIPTLNEQALLARTIHGVRADDASHEVIVVDGGSTDGTTAIATAADARVVTSERGRGSQMNAGAAVARGAIFLFLHADTLLPPDWSGHVRRVLARPAVAAGAFHLRIDGSARGLRLVERIVRWRSTARRRPYGDQGMFLAASRFQEVGGFPETPLLEDIELLRRLRTSGRIEIADAAVRTSDRRWRRHGVLGTTAMNQACLVAHRLGVSPDRIARWRNAGAEPARHERATAPA